MRVPVLRVRACSMRLRYACQLLRHMQEAEVCCMLMLHAASYQPVCFQCNICKLHREPVIPLSAIEDACPAPLRPLPT